MLFLPLYLLLAGDAPASVTLDRSAALQAMRKTLASRPNLGDANLEIVDLSRFAVPSGEIEFDWRGLTAPATGQSTTRWRGFIREDATHTFAIWAVVKLTVPCSAIIATQSIRPDEPILASQIREEAYDGFPGDTCNSTIGDVIGKVATRNLSANAPINPTLLAPPAAVLKGDQAVAEYRSDAVHLSLPVTAERSGRIGEVIPVLNQASHKVFQAQVVGQGLVVIDDQTATRSGNKSLIRSEKQ